jgi:hypothetical protein
VWPSPPCNGGLAQPAWRSGLVSVAPFDGPVAYHGPIELAWSGGIRRWGYKGCDRLGFNPNPPPSSLTLQLGLDFSTACFGLDPCHRRLAPPRRRGSPVPLPSTPIHDLPHPFPHPWRHLRPAREIPSPRSVTGTARVGEMDESAEDPSPYGA